MKVLSKKFWVLYIGTQIKNADWNQEQTGFCNVGAGLDSAEFDTIEEIEQFVSDNSLVYIDEDERQN